MKLTHLMSEDLLAACGRRSSIEPLSVTPTHSDVTCPHCISMSDIEALRQAVIDASIDYLKNGDARPRWRDTVIALLAATASSSDDDEPIWVERTWRDVRAGDTVRPPKSDAPAAYVNSAAPQSWHVDPVNVNWVGVGDEGKRAPVPIPMNYSVIHAELSFPAHPGDVRRYDMKPDAGVEILLTRGELRATEIFGWDSRLNAIDTKGGAS